MPTPRIRIRRCNDSPVAPDAAFVLYWMIAARRTRWNFALQRAVEHCVRLGLPLVVLEPLSAAHPWACDRFHRFVIQGMVDNQARLSGRDRALGRLRYYPYVEPRIGAGKGLVEALAQRAAAVVTDDFPAFILPAVVRAAASRLPVRLEAVDSNGLLPLRAADRTFPTAFLFRRFLQRRLPGHLGAPPERDPLARLSALPTAIRSADPLDVDRPGVDPPDGDRAGVNSPRVDPVPSAILRRWPPADLSDPAAGIARLPIDHNVVPVAQRGGSARAEARLSTFVDDRLPRYATDRNQPEIDATSGLSPHLHFGHISAHQIFDRIAAHERWTPLRIAPDAAGRRAGWWGMGESAEAFLDQLVTWRELGFNRCVHVANHDTYEALPAWARTTLAEHASDPRDPIYDIDAFERARTHDPLWNAAQNQLRREGRIHNYLRMLWGKKILEWSESPRTALQVMIRLNDKYALDGRDPNSYTGILWVLGLHDRAWGPERPVFGKVRYMSSANTARKYRVRRYVEEHSAR